MEEQIRQLSHQLRWQPSVANPDSLSRADKFIVAGMGGSSLAAGLLKVYQPTLDLLLHRDYGLPRVPGYFLGDSLIILSSYSGNTAEVLDTARLALDRQLKLAVVASGGELLQLARARGLAHVVLPSGLQPRMALGYTLKALIALMGQEKLGVGLDTVGLNQGLLEGVGASLAGRLLGQMPVIYSSTPNYPLAYHWKISLNETGKTPAFANAFPELNHNEMQSYAEGGYYRFIFLNDPDDADRISRRFGLLQELYNHRGLPVEMLVLPNRDQWTKIFYSVSLAMWTSLKLAQSKGVNPESVPLIEEFKKKLV